MYSIHSWHISISLTSKNMENLPKWKFIPLNFHFSMFLEVMKFGFSSGIVENYVENYGKTYVKVFFKDFSPLFND